MNPAAAVDRLDTLVQLTSSQRTAAIAIVTEENDALQALAPGRDRAVKGMPIRQTARAQLRALLTPAQQAVYDITPQYRGGGAMFDPARMVHRLDKLVHLSADQSAAATIVFEHQLQALAPLSADERRGAGTVKVNTQMRTDIRALLTPEQQQIYDTSPQTEGGGAMVNVANRTSSLDRTVTLSDAQVLQVATLYQSQVSALAALAPDERQGPKAKSIFQATRAQVRAVLTPEQQAKFDANPTGAPDMEEKAFVSSVIKSSPGLIARLGAISRVVSRRASVTIGDEQVLNGEYRCRVVGASRTENLTVSWERAPETGAISIIKVVGEDGIPIPL